MCDSCFPFLGLVVSGAALGICCRFVLVCFAGFGVGCMVSAGSGVVIIVVGRLGFVQSSSLSAGS